MTLRVETPCTYISANARFTDCSLRLPRSSPLGVKTTSPHLGHLEGDFSQAREHGLGLVAINLIQALGAALVGHGPQVLGALDARGFVDQDAQGFARAIQTIGKQAGVGLMQRLGNFVEIGSLGHDKFFLW